MCAMIAATLTALLAWRAPLRPPATAAAAPLFSTPRPVARTIVLQATGQSSPEDEATVTAAAVVPLVVSRFFTVRVTSMIVCTLAAFTAAFSRLERWSVPDAAYFVCSTATTIGFGDLRPASHAGRALTVMLACCGVGLLGNLVSATLTEWERTVQSVPQTSTQQRWRMWRAWDRLGLWYKAVAQFAMLMIIGVLGLRFFEHPASRQTWTGAAYLVAGTLTTAGLGDLVPSSRAAKNFVALYSLVGTIAFARLVGRIALRPLEEKVRAAQKDILSSYGWPLTEDSLAALARGPLVKRLGLSQDDDFCTRNEYSLLMLMQQGKVSENDLLEVRAAFNALDADGSGRLTQRDLELLQYMRDFS